MSDVATAPGYFQRHIFFCLNQRLGGEACCCDHDAKQAFDHCKSRIQALGLAGAGQVRVNKAGCLGRCAAGPVAVVYPDAVWYSFVDTQDIDEIIDSHLCAGVVVQRLLVAPEAGC